MTPVAKLQAIIAIPTVSYADPGRTDTEAFGRLRKVMAGLWPRVHALETIDVAEHGLLVRWPGRSSDRPVVLMAHLDVVPVARDDWNLDPFGAEIADGSVWGRGTLDDKGCVAAICEAAEQLLADGTVPAQDVWLSFGSDEETGGSAAREAVRVLRERGVRPWLVLDEGGAVAHDAFPSLTAPVGVVGVAEKGSTSLRLTVTGDGGTPPPRYATARPSAWPAPSPGWTPRRCRPGCPRRPSNCSGGWPRTRRGRCGRCSPTPAGPPRR